MRMQINKIDEQRVTKYTKYGCIHINKENIIENACIQDEINENIKKRKDM